LSIDQQKGADINIVNSNGKTVNRVVHVASSSLFNSYAVHASIALGCEWMDAWSYCHSKSFNYSKQRFIIATDVVLTSHVYNAAVPVISHCKMNIVDANHAVLQQSSTGRWLSVSSMRYCNGDTEGNVA